MKSSQMPISAIRRDGGTQIRAGLDEATVAKYAEALKAGATFPPVVVFFDGKVHWLGDGFHTTEAHLRNGVKRIAVDERKGTLRDAILYACGANELHGLPRTNEDKRRAVEVLLGDPEWSAKADRWIAEKARVSHDMVARARANWPGMTVAARQGRDGKQRQLPERLPKTAEGRAGAGDAEPSDDPCEGERCGAQAGDSSASSPNTAPEPRKDLDVLKAALVAFDHHLRSAQACLSAVNTFDPTLAAQLQSLKQGAHELAARARKTVAPAGDCLYCKDPNGDHGRRHECHGCKGLGYLTEDQLSAVPAQLVGTDQVVDAKAGAFVAAKQVVESLRPQRAERARRLRIEDEAGNELVTERDEDEDATGWG